MSFPCPLCSLLVVLLLAAPLPAQAAWETVKIDTDTSIPEIELDGDLAAYEKQGDIFVHRISAGRLTRVTRDGHDREDRIIGLDAPTLWYWEQDNGSSSNRLHRYSAETGLDECLFAFDDPVDGDQGTAGAGRVVILRNHDWFLFENDRLEQVTFSGEGLAKQDAWLSGDYLVWRAVSGTPGVYVTHVPSAETRCILDDEDPPVSLWVSGMHAAWVSGPAQGLYWILACRLDTGTVGVVGSSEDILPGQLTMDGPRLVWLKKVGPVWMVMATDLQEETEECLHFTQRSVHTPRVSGDNLLLVTTNCPDGAEECSELNVFNQNTGILTQLTYFGRDSVISSPRIDGKRIAFRRESRAFLPVEEAHVGLETPDQPAWALPGADSPDTAVNLALLVLPLAIAPWGRLRLLRRRRGPAVAQEVRGRR